MIELREVLEADGLTPAEVGAFADPASRWITVDSALLLIEQLHPVTRPAAPPLRTGGSTAPRSLNGESPTRRPEPPGRVTAAEGSSSGVTPLDPAADPLSVAGSGPSPRPTAQA